MLSVHSIRRTIDVYYLTQTLEYHCLLSIFLKVGLVFILIKYIKVIWKIVSTIFIVHCKILVN